jgi:hypothetical protein
VDAKPIQSHWGFGSVGAMPHPGFRLNFLPTTRPAPLDSVAEALGQLVLKHVKRKDLRPVSPELEGSARSVDPLAARRAARAR